MPYKDKEKQKAYARCWMRKRRQEYFNTHGSCVECGAWEKLCLHHKDPDSKISHCIWSWSAERREKELAKCVVMCKKCHNMLHAKERYKHGGLGRYQAGCRCDACKKAKSIENKRNRRRVGREKKD